MSLPKFYDSNTDATDIIHLAYDTISKYANCGSSYIFGSTILNYIQNFNFEINNFNDTLSLSIKERYPFGYDSFSIFITNGEKKVISSLDDCKSISIRIDKLRKEVGIDDKFTAIIMIDDDCKICIEIESLLFVDILPEYGIFVSGRPFTLSLCCI